MKVQTRKTLPVDESQATKVLEHCKKNKINTKEFVNQGVDLILAHAKTGEEISYFNTKNAKETSQKPDK